ncbi:MAG: hypothetical protein JNJ57_03030 [Saprospiraceae bacterium]|nr:hypothetical protein [Saprospiraceae bacterium]
MKTLQALFVALVCISDSYAQNITPPCPMPPPPGASQCDLTCLYCNIDGYSGINDVYSGGNTVCGLISMHNPVWHAFVAGTSVIYFTIENHNCMNGDGLQAAIFSSCDDPNSLACNAGGGGLAEIPIFIGYDDFTPGATYYLMIDGFVGDICDYTIDVTDGQASPPVPGIVATPTGPTAVCPGMVATYSVPVVPNAGYYHWVVPPDAKINGLANNVFLDPSNGETITVEFGNIGGQVCVAVGSSCIGEGSMKCLAVANQPIPPTILPPVIIPFDQTPYEFNGIFLSTPGVYNPTVTMTSEAGCDSTVKQKITILPAHEGHTSGIVFWDADADGVFDQGEQPYLNGAVVQSSSGLFTNSGAGGHYLFDDLPTGDTVRVNPPAPGLTVTPAFRTKLLGVYGGYDFGLSPVPNQYDLSVNLGLPFFRPGFTSAINLNCHNAGVGIAPNVEVTITIPLDQLDLISITPSNADISVNGNTITWVVGNMAPGQIKNLIIKVKIPVGTPLGTTYTYQASVTPIDEDTNIANNFQSQTALVVGSYDPNDKLVEPAYVTPGMLANGTPFEYTIRFQNTGTFPAEFVRIVDSLGSTVNPGTFRFIASSHPCTWAISGNGVVEFFFNNIQLPDSTSNEPESHGFVRFSVMPKHNLPLGSFVRNFCDIYFDFNPPIRTNTAGTQVVFFLPGDGLSVQDALIVRPNPAVFSAFCNWQTPAPADGRLRLFDVAGLPKVEIPVTEGQDAVHVAVQGLEPGVYFVLLEAGDLILTNKLVVARVGLLWGN